MRTIEILFSTAQSEGDYDSRILECDEWQWGVRPHHTVDVHRNGVLVAQFDAATVLGVVDLAASAEDDEDDEDDEDEGDDEDEDDEDDEDEGDDEGDEGDDDSKESEDGDEDGEGTTRAGAGTASGDEDGSRRDESRERVPRPADPARTGTAAATGTPAATGARAEEDEYDEYFDGRPEYAGHGRGPARPVANPGPRPAPVRRPGR